MDNQSSKTRHMCLAMAKKLEAQAKLDREQPIPVPSSWENDALGNTTLFLSLEETLRSYNIAEVGTDRSRQNVFIQFTPKGKEK